MGKENVTNVKKATFSALLQHIVTQHVEIMSASARHMARKDTGEKRISLLGGMTKVGVYFIS